MILWVLLFKMKNKSFLDLKIKSKYGEKKRLKIKKIFKIFPLFLDLKV